MNSGRTKKAFLLLAATSGIVALLGGITSCGNKNCTIADRALGEPSCSSQRLSWQVSPLAPANCVGTPGSRNLTINCPASTGTSGMCTAQADGFTIFVVLVPNNAGGKFIDTNGTGATYTSCQQLWTDLQSNLVAGVKGIYTSDNSTGNRLNCDNTNGCTLIASAGCFAGWDAVAKTTSGTASIAAGSNLLACAYIDNSPLSGPGLPAPAPASYGAWASPLVPFNNITGTLSFSNTGPTTWQDAY